MSDFQTAAHTMKNLLLRKCVVCGVQYFAKYRSRFCGDLCGKRHRRAVKTALKAQEKKRKLVKGT